MTRGDVVPRKALKGDAVRPERERDEQSQAACEKPAALPVGDITAPTGVLSSPPPADREEAETLALLMKALGSKDPHFAQGLLQQILCASERNKKYDLTGFLFTLAVAKSTAPRDELEAMQVTQMAVIHAAMMKAAGELARANTLVHQEVATRAISQLARTYTAQMEVLKRYRAGAEQPLSVQNVSVSQGGQAIVTQSSAPAAREVANALPALTDARQQPIGIVSEPQRDSVSRPPNAEPATSSDVKGDVPVTRPNTLSGADRPRARG
jgi:hypothetical protein